MDARAEIFFDFLRDLLYNPDKASGHAQKLGDEDEQLAKGMAFVANCVFEQKAASEALAKGNLSGPAPPPENELAAPLKMIQASLKHITWQSQQVAKGDYKQRVDFMGEFSESFNTMVEQLDQREKALEKEMEIRRQRTLALEQSNSLLEALTDKIPQWIIVVDKVTKSVLFTNDSAENILKSDTAMAAPLHEWLVRQTDREGIAFKEESVELVLASDSSAHYFTVVSYPLSWKKRNAVAHVFTDVSAERQQVRKLENYAYQDNLTHRYNRFYGMQVLRDWVEESRAFALCFVDLDNLKNVNDSFGHREGDRYLILVAEQLVAAMPSAVVCRLGGDEFMVLAENCTKEECESQMLVVRTGLIKQNVNRAYPASISFGVVQVEENNKLPASELLAIADDRMYQYKRAHKAARRKEKTKKEKPPLKT